MQEQQQLWPPVEDIWREPRVWEALSPEERATVIARLVRLIIKTVCPATLDEIQENEHEQ